VAKKVMVAMSGGVDSSVAAALLQEQGYEVYGATLKLFGNEDIGIEERTRTCCSLADVDDAMSVACKMGFAHYTFNFGRQFSKEVIQRFADAYMNGETPNPCIDCNRYIKFKFLLQRAMFLQMDFIATGHYARVEFDEKSGRWLLKKAKDSSKDQSYVLYAMTQEELSKTLFPLGNLLKSEVRLLAEERALINAQKPDSQDICFVKDGDYAGFLEKVMGIRSVPGDFINKNGKLLGRHKGIIHYTIGQRRGIDLSFYKPKYVIRIDKENNTIILGDEKELFIDSLIAKDVNFISLEKLRLPMKVTVKTRYKQTETPATLTPLQNGLVQMKFERPQRAITPGQAVVFYDGDIVVGGGTILR